jgi:hypothetical protein
VCPAGESIKLCVCVYSRKFRSGSFSLFQCVHDPNRIEERRVHTPLMMMKVLSCSRPTITTLFGSLKTIYVGLYIVERKAGITRISEQTMTGLRKISPEIRESGVKKYLRNSNTGIRRSRL